MARNKIEINLKNNLNQILSERKIQKIELAQRLGISFQAMGNICNGHYNPSFSLALQICKELNLSIGDVFYIDEDKRERLFNSLTLEALLFIAEKLGVNVEDLTW